MSKWYVTIDKQSSYIDEPDECVWTVSRDPNTTGWCTDSGYSGYGLTKADAEELANAVNEIDRLRAELRRIAHAPHGKVYCADGHEEAVLIARAAIEEEASHD